MYDLVRSISRTIISFAILMITSMFVTKGLGFRSFRGASALLRLQKVNCLPLSTTTTYRHTEIEQKWQKYWDEHGTFVSTRRVGHPKKYVLDMFPYPSGAGLHVGHPEGYTATDIMARYWRMKDYDVLHPMGWDSFGLPAEQHAINTGTHPAQTTYANIATFKRQLKALGFSYDWTRELATTDDEYVKWTQWIFLQLFKAGLANQSEISVNWCPKLGTVLANEEIINGLSERGNHPVIRQPLRQWMLKITQYADKLEEGLGLDASNGTSRLQWPEGTLSAQKQWIGKSADAEVSFFVPSLVNPSQSIDVFTTRPDTLMGVSYLVLAPEHPLVDSLTSPDRRSEVQSYKAQVSVKSDMQRTSVGKDRGKTGVSLGSCAIHPLTGEEVPIWIADYVLAGYGTGAVMAVPAHDERDFEFAALFGLSVKQVIKPTAADSDTVLPFTGEGIVVNSGAGLDGLSSAAGQDAVISRLEVNGKGRRQVTYKLRDWVFSRQRYWGEPIPIYFPVEMLTPDGTGSPIDAPHRVLYDRPIAVEETELPLKLPDMEDFHPGDDPRGCLARAHHWRFFQRDGQWFARETNTMPQWAGSCWYYLRFTDTKNTTALMGPEAASWLPVDLYVGGQEHAVLHLLYARFWHKVLFDVGVVDHPEPFLKLVHQGMILGSDGEKMSKSRGNVVNPDDIIAEHGADALRLYEMFMGPLEAVKPWQSSQLMGVVRFRDRIFKLVLNKNIELSNTQPKGTRLKNLHKIIKKVTGDIETMAFNTAISNLMIYSNSLVTVTKDPTQQLTRREAETLVLLISPFAPHVAEECWQILGYNCTLAYAPWPEYQEDLCVEERCTVNILVNGKPRGFLETEAPGSEGYTDAVAIEKVLLSEALSLERVAAAVAGKPIKKTIFVPGKILNLIV